ncbi:MAG: HAMP domain-containing histidine kinase [Hyphomonadaceae bacterium]|nr:HAMP domain-containing histidine kinase [Hyphomonadaceae bacterium]
MWLGACAAASLAAALTGAAPARLAGFAAVAAMPAATGFILMSRFTQNWARIYFFAAWALAAAMLAIQTGGAGSAMIALFLVAPAYSIAIGGGDFAWSAVVSAAGYAVAAALGAGQSGLGLAPEGLALAALGLSGALMLIAREAPPSEPPARRIAELAHELRTPLNHMVGFAELIEKQTFGPIDARYADYAGLIATSGRQMAEMVTRRLDFSRAEAGGYKLHPETFDARAAAEEAVKLAHASAAQKGIMLTALLPEEALTLRADRVAVRQILANIIGNAIKFTPTDGRVEVHVRRADAMIAFEIEDTGPGIAMEDRARVMLPYERGSGGAEGSGLGLALVKMLAEQHGGDVKIGQSEKGGALVRVRLPAA